MTSALQRKGANMVLLPLSCRLRYAKIEFDNISGPDALRELARKPFGWIELIRCKSFI